LGKENLEGLPEGHSFSYGWPLFNGFEVLGAEAGTLGRLKWAILLEKDREVSRGKAAGKRPRSE